MTYLNYIDYTKLINNDNPTIVQIGAHDGILGEEYGFQDILNSFSNFNLFLVEPLSPYFDNLINVYKKYENKVKYYKFAISDVNGIVRMKEQGCMSHISNDGNVSVESKTWNEFLKITNIKNIDLLLLDCEGYEFNILKQIDYIKTAPKVIRYEFYHIPNKEECDEYLKANKYSINYCIHDSISNKVAHFEN